MKKVSIAIVGVLGAVGQQMVRILESSDIPVEKLIPLDTAEHTGTQITFRGETCIVREAGPGAFIDADITLFSAGADASLHLAPLAVAEGTLVIDNSSCWRMDPKVPLVVPEVNPDDAASHQGIIANPNCSTIQMVVALAPIHRVYGIKRIVVSTYQAVSGSGMPAIDELTRQSTMLLAGNIIEKEHCRIYPHQIGFNALPHIDVFEENGYTKEEMKMVLETHRILDPNIQVAPTAVRIPVFRGHSESVNLELNSPASPESVRSLLAQAPGVVVQDDPNANLYPLASEAEGTNPVYVGRIRRDETVTNGLQLWIVADNLLKGAALNTVQIAALVLKRSLL